MSVGHSVIQSVRTSSRKAGLGPACRVAPRGYQENPSSPRAHPPPHPFQGPSHPKRLRGRGGRQTNGLSVPFYEAFVPDSCKSPATAYPSWDLLILYAWGAYPLLICRDSTPLEVLLALRQHSHDKVCAGSGCGSRHRPRHQAFIRPFRRSRPRTLSHTRVCTPPLISYRLILHGQAAKTC